MAKSTWNEKLNDSKDMPCIKEVSAEAALKYGGSKMLLAPPLFLSEILS